jgi:hypothetical protein
MIQAVVFHSSIVVHWILRASQLPAINAGMKTTASSHFISISLGNTYQQRFHFLHPINKACANNFLWPHLPLRRFHTQYCPAKKWFLPAR